MKTTTVFLVVVAFLSQGTQVEGGILDTLVGTVSGVVSGAFGTITQFGSGITKPIQGATQIVGNLVQSFVNLLTVGFDQTVSITGNVATSVVDLLGGILNGFITIANKIVTGEFSFYRDVIQVLFDTLAKGINLVVTTVMDSAAGVRNMISMIRSGFRSFIVGINDQVTDCMTRLNALGLTSAAKSLKDFLWNLNIATNIVQEAIISQLNIFSSHLNATALNLTIDATEFIRDITNQITDLTPNNAEFQECLKELTENLAYAQQSIFLDMNQCMEMANSTIIGIMPNIAVIKNATEDAVDTVCNCVAGITLGSLIAQRVEAKICSDAAAAGLSTDILKTPLAIVTKEVADILGEVKGTFDLCTSNVTSQIPDLNLLFTFELETCIESYNGK